MGILIVARSVTEQVQTHMLEPLRRLWPAIGIELVASGLEAVESQRCRSAVLVIVHDETPWSFCLTDLQRIRACCNAPVVVSAPGIGEAEEIALLTAGADAVLVLPWTGEKLIALLRSVSRRAGTLPPDTGGFTNVYGNFEMDGTRLRARCGDAMIRLSPTEFRILSELASHAGRSVSQNDLTMLVWGHDSKRHRDALKVHVSRIRARLAAAGCTSRIVGSRGGGYHMEFAEKAAD